MKTSQKHDIYGLPTSILEIILNLISDFNMGMFSTLQVETMNLKRVISIIFVETGRQRADIPVSPIVTIGVPRVSSVNFLLIFLLCSGAIQLGMMAVAA